MGGCCANLSPDASPDAELVEGGASQQSDAKRTAFSDEVTEFSRLSTNGNKQDEDMAQQTRNIRKTPTKTTKEMDKILAARSRGHRDGISAAVVTAAEVDNFVKPVYQKTREEEAVIEEIIKGNQKMQVICPDLSGDALKDVINAFFPTQVKQGHDVIRQFEQGDCLFICESGELEIFVNRLDAAGNYATGKGDKVLTVGPGSLFGELALMYSSPRAATVTVASSVAKLWALEQNAFKMLLRNKGPMQIEMYDGYLLDVEILKSLNNHELSELNSIMESTLYDDGEEIVIQGEKGDAFYIVEDGTCAAYMTGPDGTTEKEVAQYGIGDYFGELALLTNQPRQATIRGTGEGVTVASFTREDFDNLLGPIKETLLINSEDYLSYSQY